MLKTPVHFISCRQSWRSNVGGSMEGQDRTGQRALKLPFIFKKFLVSICFQVILTSVHKLGKNTSPFDASLSFWKINLMRQRLKSFLTLKRNLFLLQMSLISKYSFKNKRVVCLQCARHPTESCGFQILI